MRRRAGLAGDAENWIRLRRVFEFRHGNLVKSALKRGLAATLPETRD
jgi:hypothetical protein